MTEAAHLIIVEDDAAFARTLKRSFERRGYEVRVAAGQSEMQALIGAATPTHAVVDLKLGSRHYLAKPSNTDEIEAAFAKSEGDANVKPGERPSSIKTLEWALIHRTLAESDFNISESARRLGMHRRTLARKLDKRRVD